MARPKPEADTTPRLYIVDDDPAIRTLVRNMVADHGIVTEEFDRAEGFLDGYCERPMGCVLLDVRLPGMSGLDLLDRMAGLQPSNPVIVLSGFADIPTAVQAVKQGAIDFLQKPFTKAQLLPLLEKAFAAVERAIRNNWELQKLTPREREVLVAFRDGAANKVVAANLGLSPRTVEMYRARIFQKLGVGNLAQALRHAREAGLLSEAQLQTRTR